MATRPAGNPRFSFGKSLSDTFTVFGANFLTLIGITLLLYGVPTALFGLVTANSMQDAIANPGTMTVFGTMYFAGMALSVLLYAAAQVAATHVSLEGRFGRQIHFGESLLVALRLFLPALGIVIIYTVGFVVIGLLFTALVVGLVTNAQNPGSGFLFGLILFLLFAWAIAYFAVSFLVVLPAYIAEEETGVIGCFGRSWNLTRGHKLKIFVILLLVFIGMSIVVFAIMMVAAPAMMAGDSVEMSSSFGIFIVLQAIAYTITLAFFYPLIAMIYFNLRETKEGVLHEQIAQVFE